MDPNAAEPTASVVPDAVVPAHVASSSRAGAWLLAGTHALVDVFPMAIVSLMIVLSDRLSLTAGQETVVWITTPIFSGLFQPLFAWLGDRYDTRLAGPLGLAIAAVCISSIGFAQSFGQLLALQIVGVIGVGMYHPAAAAVAGQMGSGKTHGRAFAMSVFIAAGMVGHTLGPVIATRVNAWFGMEHLAWLIPPSLLLAVLLHGAVRHAPHRPHDHHILRSTLAAAELRLRWIATILLTIQGALRFCVNVGMYIVLNYWAYSRIRDPDAAAVLAGNLTAATTIGMGIGSLLVGRFLRPGTERRALALLALGGAVCVALTNMVAGAGYLAVYAAVCLAAVGFFGPVPAAIGLGQRLLPSHAGLATSLLMGVGWMFGAVSRPVSSLLLGARSLEEADQLSGADFDRTFLGFALLLVVAGLLALAMPARAIRDAARIR
ncbi:MAG: MFS transporter [Planctomycetota bacterium]